MSKLEDEVLNDDDVDEFIEPGQEETASTQAVEESTPQKLACPTCGNADLEIISKDFAQCPYCGSKVAIPKAKQETKVYKQVIYNTYNGAAPEKEKVPCYVFESSEDFSEVDFMFNYLIFIYANVYTPEDFIEKAEFSPVETETLQFMKVDFDYTASFRAKLGTDKKVPYQVTHYDENNNVYYETEEKTVTDWTPYSDVADGTRSRLKQLVAEDEEAVKGADSRLLSLINKYEDPNGIDRITRVPFEESDVQVELRDMSEQEVQALMKQSDGEIANYHARNLPCDRYQQYSCSVKYNKNTKTQYVVNDYVLKYKYNGKEHEGRTFAAFTYDYSTNPEIFDSSIAESNKNAKEDALNKMKRQLNIIKGLGAVLFVAAAAVVFFLYSIVIALVILGTYAIFSAIINVIIKNSTDKILKMSKSDLNEKYALMQENKKQKFVEFCASHNLGEVGEENLKLFDVWKKTL